MAYVSRGLLLLLRSPGISLGFRFTSLGEILAYVTVFNPTIEVVTFRLRGWCMLGVCVWEGWGGGGFFLLLCFVVVVVVVVFASIHPSRTGSFESVRWNACVHRLELGLYSHPKEFWGNGSQNPC